LLSSFLAAVSSAPVYDPNAPLGSEANPHPEHYEHEDEEEASDAEAPIDTLSHYEDTDSGTLTEDHLRTLHGKLDKNGDGKVHMDEVLHFAHHTRKAVVKKEIAGVFDEIESTQDGTLSLEEHMSEVAEFHKGDEDEIAKQREAELAKFKAADTNGDDKLDVEELVHLMHPETHPEVLEVHTKEEMRLRDTDKDGKLSQKEWETASKRGEYQDPDTHDPTDDFEKLDANKDGSIDMDELRHWESGRFHTEHAMKKLYHIADKDKDHHMTVDELVSMVEHIDGHDAHPHILDWVFHEDL